MSFKAQIQVINDSKWYDNGLRFETEAETIAYGRDLFDRWMQAERYQVVESDEAANATFNRIENRVKLWETSKRDLDSIEEGSD